VKKISAVAKRGNEIFKEPNGLVIGNDVGDPVGACRCIPSRCFGGVPIPCNSFIF
jgi:hypothetical protein